MLYVASAAPKWPTVILLVDDVDEYTFKRKIIQCVYITE